MVYLLWDIFILESDCYFLFFIALALLIENKHKIIGSETASIPQTLASLVIENVQQMGEVYNK